MIYRCEACGEDGYELILLATGCYVHSWCMTAEDQPGCDCKAAQYHAGLVDALTNLVAGCDQCPAIAPDSPALADARGVLAKLEEPS